MSSDQNLRVVSNQLVKTFVITLISTYLVIFLFFLKTKNQPVPAINQLSTATASLSLTTTANQPLDPNTTLNVKANYSTDTPAHFIQIVFEFDPQVLEFTGQIEKLHSFPFHKQKYLASKNQIRISASGINPDNPKDRLRSQSGNGSLAKIAFKVKSNPPATTKLTTIISSAGKPWGESAIIQINSDQEIVNLLSQATDLTLTLSQSETNNQSPLPSDLNSSPLPEELFPTLTDLTTPVNQTTSSAPPSSTLKASPKASLPPTPDPSPSPTPDPQDQNPPWWQQLQILFSRCRFNPPCYFQP